MRDRRSTPFFYITTGAAQVLRAEFPIKPRGQRTAALAIYAAMCEIANEQRSNQFEAPRKTIADYAGVSIRSLSDYVPRLVDAGLIDVERRQEGGVHMPHEWSLIDVAPRVAAALANGGETTLERAHAGGGEPAALPVQPLQESGSQCTTVGQPLQEGRAAGARHARPRNEEEERTLRTPFPPATEVGGAPLTSVPRTGAVPGRRRERERLAAEQRAWLDEHPATAELQEHVAPVLERAAERVDQGTFAVQLAPLHAHAAAPHLIVFGAPRGTARWIQDRFGPLLSEIAGTRVRVIECDCPANPYTPAAAAVA